MTSNTRISMEFNLPRMKDRVVTLIAHFTGEDIQVLLKKSIDELLQHLSHIMQCEEETVRNLLRSHDQNAEFDIQTLSELWKVISKGVVKQKKHSLGAMPEEVYKQLKFVMAQLGDISRLRAENRYRPPTSALSADVNTVVTHPHSLKTIVGMGQAPVQGKK